MSANTLRVTCKSSEDDQCVCTGRPGTLGCVCTGHLGTLGSEIRPGRVTVKGIDEWGRNAYNVSY